ncbi:hypothetical protein EMCRGX_G021103 [Ephydatia muelleri]
MWLHRLVVFAVTFAVYINSLKCGFVFDDHRGILTNDDLDPKKTTVWDLLQHDFWGGAMSRVESHKSYRPLTVLTYRYLNYHFSELRPYTYHLVNVLMHCAASLLFLGLSERALGKGSQWACFAALLFGVHSVHTEAVASVVGRAESLSCIFFLLAILAYLRAVSFGCGRSLRTSPMTNWRYVALSICFTVCSVLSKEQGVTAVGVCVVCDVLLNWGSFVKWVAAAGKRGVDVTKNAADVETIGSDEEVKLSRRMGNAALKRIGVVAATTGLLLYFRMSMNYGTQPIFKPEEMKAAFHPDITVRALSFSNIYALNAWLLLAPSSLCCDWTLGSVPLVTSLWDSRNTWSIVLYGILVAIVICVVKFKQDRFAIGLGTSLLVIPFLPSTGVLLRVGFVIAERVLYTPSLGFCLLVAMGFKRLFILASGRKALQQAVIATMLYTLVVMSVKTVDRNKDWESDLTLFESGVKVIPENVKIRNNYAMELKSAGRLDEARLQYQRSLELDPDYGEIYFNYGNLLYDTGNLSEAAIYFERAIKFPYMYAKTLNNLATIYYRQGRYKEAESRFRESLQLATDQATTYNNLASLLGELKRFSESEEMFRKALEVNPTYVEAHFNLGTLYVQMGRLDDAEVSLQHALRLNPNHRGAINNLDVVHYYRKNGLPTSNNVP